MITAQFNTYMLKIRPLRPSIPLYQIHTHLWDSFQQVWPSLLAGFLKDAFFFLCFASVSQPVFVFQKEDPATGIKEQLTWTRLPYRFQNSPTVFGEVVATDLKAFITSGDNLTLIQYVDDFLLAALT